MKSSLALLSLGLATSLFAETAQQALAPKSVFFGKNKLSRADETMFRMFRELAGGEGGVRVMPKEYDFTGLREMMAGVPAKGFLFIDVRKKAGIRMLLQREGWEMLPFMWRTYHIYRKPLEGAA